jgi:hypothetical protein
VIALVPNSWGSTLFEYNPHHEPGGSPKGGQFARARATGLLAGGRAVMVRPGQSVNIAEIGSRRFLFNAKSGHLALGMEQIKPDGDEDDPEGSHGVALSDAGGGVGRSYDRFQLRGMVGSRRTADGLRVGVWIAQVPEDAVERSDALAAFAGWLRRNGAPENTEVTGTYVPGLGYVTGPVRKTVATGRRGLRDMETLG